MTDSVLAIIEIVVIPVVTLFVFGLLEQKIARSHYRLSLLKTTWDVQILTIGLLGGYLFKDLHLLAWNQAGFTLFCITIVCLATAGLFSIQVRIHTPPPRIPTSDELFHAVFLAGISLLSTMGYVVLLLVGGNL